MTEVREIAGPETDPVGSAPLDVSDATQPAESITPGSVLRRTREARGQSIADVVQVIRFSAHQIAALERDDYASLPGATSVRGLVRNYAKFLKLDATPLLAQLEPAVPVPEADVRPPSNMGEAEQSSIAQRVPRSVVVIGVVLVLLALAGYGYLKLDEDGSLGRQLRGAESSPAMAPPASVAASSGVPVLAPAPTVVAESAPVVAGEASGALPFAGLRVEFDDRSWIEVRDAAQKIVFVGEYPAGTRQNVEGKPPFQIWIGKASGVRLFMGERSIDLKPHIREEVARFTLE